MENLEFLKCYYRPSFFRMKIDVPVDFNNLLEISDATFSLYLHEYIHFLQDISTIYGLMNISTITYYLHDVAHRLTKQDSKEFKVPIELINDHRDYGYNNFKLKPIYIGSSINPKKEKIEITGYRKDKIQWGDAASEVIDVIYVEGIDLRNQQSFSFQLGGNHITEGMAYLSERFVYEEILSKDGVVMPVDEYPYLVAQKIAELIYPEFGKEELLVIAACDVSLMSYHPGLNFVRLLEYFRDISFLKETVELSHLYKEGQSFLKGTHVDFEVLIEVVRSELKKNFKVEHFEGNNIWIDILFDRIKHFRLAIPEFITDILQFGDPKKNRFFGELHRVLGSPLVINAESDATICIPVNFIPDNFHVSLFWAINQMMRVFSNNSPTPCEMKDYCIVSKKVDDKIVVDERCDTAPWKRCYDKDLCPFAVMWKHWGLKDHYPKLNN